MTLVILLLGLVLPAAWVALMVRRRVPPEGHALVCSVGRAV